MKAVLCRAWGTPDVLRFEAVEARAVRPNEVRIRVRAAGVNFADTLMVGGTYQVKPPFPFIPGLEAAGVKIVKDFDRKPFEDAMAAIYEKARRDPAAAELIDRIRKVE